jgi:K+ transporter
LHEQCFVLTVAIDFVPWVRRGVRRHFKKIALNFSHATTGFGFIEQPNILQ